jgi:hypothetical protein
LHGTWVSGGLSHTYHPSPTYNSDTDENNENKQEEEQLKINPQLEDCVRTKKGEGTRHTSQEMK